MIGPVTIGILAAAILAAFASAFVARRRLESRARFLEVLARAVERERPVPPLVKRIASEMTGAARRTLDRVSAELDHGLSLADAIDAAGGGLVPARDAAAIRHAGSELPEVLRDLAEEAGRTVTVRHRIGLAFVYPLLLLPLLLFTYARLKALAPILPVLDLPDLSLKDLSVYVPFLGVATVGVVVLLLSPTFVSLRPRRISFVRRITAEARLYRLTATHLDAGLPLPTALRRAAEASGRRSVAKRAEAAAARIATGESVEEVWPSFSVAGNGLAGRLRRAAELRTERQRARTERWLRLVHPATVLCFAAIVFVEFHMVVEFLALTRKAAMPW